MPFNRSDMRYDKEGYYKWTAPQDQDNPAVRGGIDRKEINRTEGYEVLGFLNRLADKQPALISDATAFQKAERMLRYHVPPKSTHQAAADCIVNNWQNYY